MTIIKCKICGGDLELSDDKTIGMCEYCGSTITLPKVSDEQRLALFNRGNHFRRIGEFDKALAIYENIVREDETDAEAHWCCAISRFGIEYVEDPNTFEYLPTCHRASFDSFLDDIDFKAALEYSDGLTRRQYQKDAAKIAEVQRGILATSQNEEPYDVFICYKETDDQTRERTKDSVDAQEIYYQLTQEGYRVFFSRVTLEDKAGTEYEPYIFAALNSAKVMVVVGTKPEYFNAVWVKNEWSRFLSMMRKDRSKILLPCYKDMDPYDLPEQLSVLQSYDMSKIGFVQDLLRGIKKIVNKNTGDTVSSKEASSIDTGVAILSAQTSALLKRGYMCLEDKDFEKAEDFFEQVLNNDPECGQAYWGKLHALFHTNDVTELGNKLYDSLIEKAIVETNTYSINRTSVLREELTDYGILNLFDEEGIFHLASTLNPKSITLKSIKKYLEKQYDHLNSGDGLSSLIKNKNFDHALQFQDETTQNNIENVTQFLKEKISERIKEEENNEEKAKRNVDKESASLRDEIKVKIQSALDQSKIKQTEAKQQLEATARLAEESYIKALQLFEENYQSQLNNWLKEKQNYENNCLIAKEKIQQLNREIEELENEKCALKGLFSGRKKSQIEERIKQLKTSVTKITIPKPPGEKPEKGPTPEKSSFVVNVKAQNVSPKETIAMVFSLNDINKPKSLELGKYFYEKEKGKTRAIKWRVLDIEWGRALIISEEGLTAKKYNDFNEKTSWEKCSLRKWLNKEFYDFAFSDNEKNCIIDSRILLDGTSNQNNPGNAIMDKIFILSKSEAEQYFKHKESRVAKATEYAIKHGSKIAKNGNCCWWLRSSGSKENLAAFIGAQGGINEGGIKVDSLENAVRPAMWIQLSKL